MGRGFGIMPRSADGGGNPGANAHGLAGGNPGANAHGLAGRNPGANAAGLAGGVLFAVLMPNGLCLPLRLLTQGEAEQLAATLNEYLDED